MASPRSASKTNAIVRGNTVFAIATPASKGRRGFALLVEGSNADQVRNVGEKLRAKVQEACRTDVDSERLLHNIRREAEIEDNLSLALALRTLDEVWLLAYGGSRIFRWSSADALAALSPKREGGRQGKWFSPRKSTAISALDRIMVSSGALGEIIEKHQLLYLHANEVSGLMEAHGKTSYGAAWAGAEHKGTEWVETREQERRPQQGLLGTQFRTIRWTMLAGVLMSFTLMAVLAFHFLSGGEDIPKKQASITDWKETPKDLERFSNPEKISDPIENSSPDVVAPPDTLEQAKKIQDPLDELVLEENETGRQARIFLLGEYREQLLEAPTPSQLPPADMLPLAHRPFFTPNSNFSVKDLARKAEALIRQSILLAKYEILQDLEAQITFREKDPHVRAWLQEVKSSTESEVLKTWARLHLMTSEDK